MCGKPKKKKLGNPTKVVINYQRKRKNNSFLRDYYIIYTYIYIDIDSSAKSSIAILPVIHHCCDIQRVYIYKMKQACKNIGV